MLLVEVAVVVVVVVVVVVLPLGRQSYADNQQLRQQLIGVTNNLTSSGNTNSSIVIGRFMYNLVMIMIYSRIHDILVVVLNILNSCIT